MKHSIGFYFVVVLLLIGDILPAQDSHWQYMDLPLIFNTGLGRNRIYSYEDVSDSVVYLYGDIRNPDAEDTYTNTSVVRYDGTDLTYLGIFGGTTVYDVIKFQDNIFAVGNIGTIDYTQSIRGFAAYDGDSWYSDWNFTGGTSMQALATDGQYLYVAGTFTAIDGVPYPGLAKYDGTTWSHLPEFEEPGFIRDMCFFQGRLYVAGNFHFNGEYASLLWVLNDDDQWTPLEMNGELLDLSIRHLKVFDGKLYLAGSFGSDAPNGSLVAYDGQNFTAPYPQFYTVNPGIGEGVVPQRMAVTTDHLYVSGGFNFIGDMTVNGLGAYNGEQFCGMFTEGNTRWIEGLFTYRDTLYAYLYFNPYSIYLYPSGIYKWVGGSDYEYCETSGIVEADRFDRFRLYPNPTRGVCYLEGAANGSTRICVYDLTGREVYQILENAQNRIRLDLQALAPGTYLLHIQNKNSTQIQKIQIQ